MKCKNFVIHSDDSYFFDTIYKKAVNFLNCKKWQKFPELVQELFY